MSNLLSKVFAVRLSPCHQQQSKNSHADHGQQRLFGWSMVNTPDCTEHQHQTSHKSNHIIFLIYCSIEQLYMKPEL